MRKIDIDEAEKILGLTGEYGEAELKAAHRKMIAEYHPDRFATQPDTMKRLATEKLQEVNEANSILKKEVSNGKRKIAGTSASASYTSSSTSYEPQSSSPFYANDYQSTKADSYDPSYDYIPEFVKPNSSTTRPQSQSQSYEPYTPTTATTTRKVRTFGWKKVVAIIIALFLITEIGGCVVSSFIEQHQKEEQAAIFDQMVEIVDYGFTPINKDETSFGVELKNKSDKYILTGAEVHVTFYDIAGNKLYSHNYITGGIALPGETVMAGDEPSVSNVARMECELVKGSVTYNTNKDNQYKTPLVVENVSLTPDNDSGTHQTFSAVVKNPNEAAFTKAKIVVTYRNAENHPVYVFFLKLNGKWAANGEDSFSQPITSPPNGQWEHYTIQASPLL